jgi:signal transduction histidine kinase/DNA-binding response OmpR family regulator
MVNENIMVIDDEETICNLCKKVLEEDNYTVDTFTDGKLAIEKFNEKNYDIVLTDLALKDTTGMEILKRVKQLSPKTDVIIMTGFVDIDSAVELMKTGAYDYIPKPFEIDNLKLRIRKCIENRALISELHDLKEIVSLYEISQAMSSSMELKQLLNLIIKLACQTLNADSGSLMLIDERTNELKIEAAYGLSQDIVNNVRIKIGENISGWVAEKGEPLLLIDGLENDPRFKHLKTRSEIKSSMIVALKLKTKQKVIGVITLNITKSKKYFTESDLKLFTLFANNASFAIQDAQVCEKLREVDRLKTEFISNTSHELKTPLMAIQSSFELLNEIIGDKIDTKSKELIGICNRNIIRMTRLINDLLDFSRIESGTLKINKSYFSIQKLINETVSELRHKSEPKKLVLEYKNPDIDIPDVFADYDRIKQVLINLIDNAIKFTPERGEIIIESKIISDKFDNQSKYILISVSDTGIGISKENIEKIFDKFYQVNGSLTRETDGLGLGLSISKNIVELHGGKIWVESSQTEPERGSKFFFILPL